MLTINNIDKLIGMKPASGKFIIKGVQQMGNQYWIYPHKADGTSLHRINIERLGMNEEGVKVYELWWWQNDEPDPAKQKPIRRMLSVYDFRVGYGALIELIDYMLKLK
jgi:hypothetical protein